jgi:predicted TIM-barrel fold metal-dependent hydrolase
VDVDSHVSEPADLWTSRAPARWAEEAPRLKWSEAHQENRWVVGDAVLTSEAEFAYAGWTKYPPHYPPSFADADPGAWDPTVRLERMDEYGISAQVLYPNLVAFATYAFRQLDPELAIWTIQAYNDFLVDFASSDLKRLVPLMALPFWDLDAAVKEVDRAADLGHKGILLAVHFDKVGLPPLWDAHWEPLLKRAEERELSINFHIGFSQMTEEDRKSMMEVSGDEHARITSVNHFNNARAIADVICTGLCARFPKLNFVSVESGGGWLPYLAESLDWHWKNFGAMDARKDLELPSFYLRRQVYGSFWFERECLARVADLLPDNLMFETDYPHPTSLTPGPVSHAEAPREALRKAMVGVDETVVRKLLHDNAARVYHLD